MHFIDSVTFGVHTPSSIFMSTFDEHLEFPTSFSVFESLALLSTDVFAVDVLHHALEDHAKTMGIKGKSAASVVSENSNKPSNRRYL